MIFCIIRMARSATRIENLLGTMSQTSFEICDVCLRTGGSKADWCTNTGVPTAWLDKLVAYTRYWHSLAQNRALWMHLRDDFAKFCCGRCDLQAATVRRKLRSPNCPWETTSLKYCCCEMRETCCHSHWDGAFFLGTFGPIPFRTTEHFEFAAWHLPSMKCVRPCSVWKPSRRWTYFSAIILLQVFLKRKPWQRPTVPPSGCSTKHRAICRNHCFVRTIVQTHRLWPNTSSSFACICFSTNSARPPAQSQQPTQSSEVSPPHAIGNPKWLVDTY